MNSYALAMLAAFVAVFGLIFLVYAVLPEISGTDELSNEKGCGVSEGYVWCDALQKCVAPWAERCLNSTVSARIESLCGTGGIKGVYLCGAYVRSVSADPQEGSTFHLGSGQINCPNADAGPGETGAECRKLLYMTDCEDFEYCAGNFTIG